MDTKSCLQANEHIENDAFQKHNTVADITDTECVGLACVTSLSQSTEQKHRSKNTASCCCLL